MPFSINDVWVAFAKSQIGSRASQNAIDEWVRSAQYYRVFEVSQDENGTLRIALPVGWSDYNNKKFQEVIRNLQRAGAAVTTI